MKKQLIALVLMLSVAASTFAVEAEIGGLWYDIVKKGNEAWVIQYKNSKYYKGSIVIPKTIEYEGVTCTVTRIGSRAFQYCHGMTSVTIGNNVTYIADYAFDSCTGLKSIVIPNSVESIASNAFQFCNSMTSITIGNSVTYIGWQAFEYCSSLTSVTIPNSVTRIQGSAFKSCSALTTITIGKGVTTIHTKAFAECPELTDVYCYAENVPKMLDGYYEPCTDAFEGSYIKYATLHVPNASINAYKSTYPWNSFKAIVGLDKQKCATPTISFADGKLKFTCKTTDVKYTYEITNADVKKGNASEVSLGGKYKVSVYATKDGYDNSDVATLEFTLGAGGKVCDVNKDGAVDVADIATIISEMAASSRQESRDAE